MHAFQMDAIRRMTTSVCVVSALSVILAGCGQTHLDGGRTSPKSEGLLNAATPRDSAGGLSASIGNDPLRELIVRSLASKPDEQSHSARYAVTSIGSVATGDGIADFTRQMYQAHLTTTRNAATYDVIIDGDRVFERGPIEPGAPQPWRHRSLRDGTAFLIIPYIGIGIGTSVPSESPQFDDRLTVARALTTGVVQVGPDMLHGSRCVHYRVDVDYDSASSRLGARLAVNRRGREAIDMWLDEAGRVRKLLTDEGLRGYELWDFGLPVSIMVPA